MTLKGIDLANPPDLVRLAVPRSRESRVVIAGSRKAHGPEILLADARLGQAIPTWLSLASRGCPSAKARELS
jgi:hypothetical protein